MRTISALDRKKQIRKRRFSSSGGESGAINGDEKRFRGQNDGVAKLPVTSADGAVETVENLDNAIESVEPRKVVSAEGTPKKAFHAIGEYGRSPLSSPTGKRIMNALDGANVHIDNFHEGRVNESQELVEEWLTAEVGRTSTRIGGGMLHDVPSNLGLIDWSLSCRLRIECLPSIAPLLLSSKTDDGCVQQLATQILSGCPSALLSNSSEQDFLAARWLASTMFYQHPAIYPVPSFVSSQAGDKIEICAKKQQCLSTYVHGPLSIYNTTRLPKAESLFESKNDEKSSAMTVEKQKRHDAALLLDRRRKEWQLAFKSLFQTWMSKLRSIQRKPKSEPHDDEMLRCVFYVLSRGRVSLFRCAKKPEGGLIEPTIEFSSVSEEFRLRMASMGILLRSKKNDLVDESLPTEETAVLEKQQPSPSDKESVSAELNAIKWADNESGKVTIDLKRKAQETKGLVDRHSRSSAVYVSGEDDCFAVYEQLLNTYGLEHKDSDHDVPLLICRSLGPCSHTTLSKLTATGQIEQGYTRQRVTNRDNASSSRAILELQGFIMPCAIRDLVCSLAHYFEGPNRPQDKDSSPTNVSDLYHGPGVKYPRFTLNIDEGLCNSQVTLPTQTSCLNNDPKGEEGENFDSMISCKDGFRVSFITWDKASPSEVTFINTQAKN